METRNRGIDATYVNIRYAQTRSVAQIVLEIPIERADEFQSLFGSPPAPGVTKWVAIAPLTGKPSSRVPGEKPAPDPEKLAMKSVLLARDPRFVTFLKETSRYKGTPEEYIREWCGVSSRGQIHLSPKAKEKWHQLHSKFQAWLIAG